VGGGAQEAIGHAAEHLSLYQLTIEAGTWFEKLHAAGRLVVPDAEAGRVLYDVTQEICGAAGMPAYEISNHARPGAESRHNLVYWRYGEYVGVGPGAHGRIVAAEGRIATATERNPEAWLDRVEKYGHGLTTSRRSRREEADEFLLMGPAPARGDRSRALPRLCRAAASTSAVSPILSAMGSSPAISGPASRSRRPGFRSSTRSWRTSRRDQPGCFRSRCKRNQPARSA
jgi:hypothetical protein